jgi:hypothetical protein
MAIFKNSFLMTYGRHFETNTGVVFVDISSNENKLSEFTNLLSPEFKKKKKPCNGTNLDNLNFIDYNLENLDTRK